MASDALRTGDSPESWRRLASFVAILNDPEFEFGRWVPSREGEDGVIHMGWFELSPAALDLVRSMVVSPNVDWPEWARSPQGKRLMSDPAAVADATPQQLIALMTTMVRGDRFSEGTLAHFHDSGHIRAVVRRAAALSRGREP